MKHYRLSKEKRRERLIALLWWLAAIAAAVGISALVAGCELKVPELGSTTPGVAQPPEPEPEPDPSPPPAPVLVRAPLATDDFERTALGVAYAQINPNYGSITIDAAGRFAASAGSEAQDNAARRIAESYSPDHYARIRLVGAFAWQGPAYFVGVAVRMSPDVGPERDYYRLTVHQDAAATPYLTRLARVHDGAVAVLAAARVAWAPGDILGLEAVGSTVTATRNGQPMEGLAVTDTTLATGSPGLAGAQSGGLFGDDAEFGDVRLSTVTPGPTPEPEPAPARTAALSWSPPTENADGTSLVDLAGYRIQHAVGAPACTEGEIRDVGQVTAYTWPDLEPGVHRWVVLAVDAAGNVSVCSAEAQKVIE